MTIWYRRILALLVAYLAQRVLFIGFNFKSLAAIDLPTLILAFIDGLRFDLCVIATINLPIIVLHSLRGTPILSRWSKALDHLVSALFAASNIPLIVFGVVDSNLTNFTGRRISPEIFEIGGDIKDQSIGIMIQFWWITLPSILLLVLFTWFNWQRDHRSEPYSIGFLRSSSLKIFVFIVISFLVVRGGWQTKPLAPAHAFRWQPVVLSNMVLNSGMTLLRTPRTTIPRRYQDFQTASDMRKILESGNEGLIGPNSFQGKNVVVLIVESLATEYVGFLNNGRGYTPFLDQLAEKSVFFKDSFANGRRSIDAMPAIFAGVPAWRDQPFVTSPYASNETEPLPRILAQQGYKTLFFHGAANGSMHFDVFARIAGFDEYLGKNEYPRGDDFDGQWGIFDEPFLQFAVEKLNTTKPPFFAGIFTLTSHNPFKIPEKYTGKFPLGTLPIHQAIGYADFALSEFFKSAESQPWYTDTIFVITGDHTSLSDNPAFNNLPGRFRVPIIFYSPSSKLPAVEQRKVASHVDIKPTLMSLLGVDQKKYGLFGGPLFSSSWKGRFIQSEWDTWYYRDESLQLTIDSLGNPAVFKLSDDHLANPGFPTISEESQMATLKAARQYFSNGLLDNSWYSIIN